VIPTCCVSWYQWLEQGRDITVSPQVLDSVGRVLRLSSVERRHLYVLAGLNSPAPEVDPGTRRAGAAPCIRWRADRGLCLSGTALETCTAFTFEQEGEQLKVTVEKITGPKAGEESCTFRTKTEIPALAMKFESDMLVARQGTGVTRVAFIPADATGHRAFDDLAERAGKKFTKGVQS
jgi:hypothetical protein